MLLFFYFCHGYSQTIESFSHICAENVILLYGTRITLTQKYVSSRKISVKNALYVPKLERTSVSVEEKNPFYKNSRWKESHPKFAFRTRSHTDPRTSCRRCLHCPHPIVQSDARFRTDVLRLTVRTWFFSIHLKYPFFSLSHILLSKVTSNTSFV